MDKSWIAGFFDGEGCISISMSGTRHCLQVSIINTCKEVLLLLQAKYGGKLYRHSNGCWVWKLLHRDQQRHFLEDVEPHLILKNPQARIALVFLDTVLDNKKHGYHPIECDVFAIRQECSDFLKDEKDRFSTLGIKRRSHGQLV